MDAAIFIYHIEYFIHRSDNVTYKSRLLLNLLHLNSKSSGRLDGLTITYEPGLEYHPLTFDNLNYFLNVTCLNPSSLCILICRPSKSQLYDCIKLLCNVRAEFHRVHTDLKHFIMYTVTYCHLFITGLWFQIEWVRIEPSLAYKVDYLTAYPEVIDLF